jgi:hypothetical protein
VIASALLLKGSAEGVSSFKIFGDEAYPQQYSIRLFVQLNSNLVVEREMCPWAISKYFGD